MGQGIGQYSLGAPIANPPLSERTGMTWGEYLALLQNNRKKSKMEKDLYEEQCKKMQEKMDMVLTQMGAKVKESTSPIDYLVLLKKFDDIMKDLAPKFATLANVEFEQLQEEARKNDNAPIIKLGATIKPNSPGHRYSYPAYVDQLKTVLDKVREECRENGTAKKGDRVSKRNFTISIK